jgi:ATP-dependent RNA helicase DeaD
MERQTLLFCATMPGPIRELARQFMRNPEIIRIEPKQVTPQTLSKVIFEIEDKQKFDILCRLLDIHYIGTDHCFWPRPGAGWTSF